MMNTQPVQNTTTRLYFIQIDFCYFVLPFHRAGTIHKITRKGHDKTFRVGSWIVLTGDSKEAGANPP